MNTFSAKSVYSNMSISRVLPMLGFVLVLGSSLPGHAQTNNWTNTANGNWITASAWSKGAVPTAEQDVYHTNVTTGTTVTINVNTNAVAKSLTVGGSGGSAAVSLAANQSLTVGGDITLASGVGGAELRLGAANVTVTLNGGSGSIVNGGGAGLASLTVQGGFSNSLGLLNASVDDLNMGQSGSGTLIITTGQTYNVSNRVRLNNSSVTTNSTATILMNGGTLNNGGATASDITFNSGTNGDNRSYLVLNGNATVTTVSLYRANAGTDAAVQWNDGTIGNFAGTNMTIGAAAGAGTMNLILAGTGRHTFNASGTNTITVAATAQLQDKTGEAGTLVKAGTGVLILSGSNSYTGGTTLNVGTVRVNDNNGLGTGNLTLNAGTLASTNARTLANNVTVGGAVALGESATGTGALTFNGTVNLGSGNTVTVNRASTFANAVSGTGTFNVATNGSVVVSGSGSMTTGTAINLTTNGTSFDISGVSGSGVTVGSVASAASSTVALGSKALTLGGDNTSTTLAGTVTGATGGSLVKNGSGTLTLTGNNAYTGATTIGGGTLLVATSGSIASSSLATVNRGLLQVNGTAGAVTVNNGGSLSGSGTNGVVTLNSGSLLNPGNSPGTLTAASSIWNSNSTYNWEINSNATNAVAGTNWDLFSVTGALDMSALSSGPTMNLVLNSLSGFDLTSSTNREWVIAQAGSLLGTGGAVLNAGANVSDYFNINATAFNAGTPTLVNEWRVEVGATGNTLNLMAIPEPSAGSMLGLGLTGLVVTRLFRRKGV